MKMYVTAVVKEKMKDKVKLSLSQKINGFFKFAPHPP
jgi:hypothetical protein